MIKQTSKQKQGLKDENEDGRIRIAVTITQDNSQFYDFYDKQWHDAGIQLDKHVL